MFDDFYSGGSRIPCATYPEISPHYDALLKWCPVKIIRVFRLEPDIAILYRIVLQNEKTKYYPTPSGNRTRAPWLQFQHAPFWATEACAT